MRLENGKIRLVETVWLFPLKYGIENAVAQGVSVETILLLLLFPMVAALVAFSRQVVGLTGFGILVPVLVSAAFRSTGVAAGLLLFGVILAMATAARFLLKRVHLPYLPRMAVVVWAIALAVLGLLLVSPVISLGGLVELSIFPILLLVMLAETYVETQITRTWQQAALMTAEALIIALIGYGLMSLVGVQIWVLSNPEVAVLATLAADYLIGKYKGLRLLEIWRFRKLLQS